MGEPPPEGGGGLRRHPPHESHYTKIGYTGKGNVGFFSRRRKPLTDQPYSA